MTVHSLRTADAAGRAAYRRRLRLRALPWSIAMLFVSWPIPLLTGLLLYRLGDLLAPWVGFALPVLWLVSGYLLLRSSAPAPDATGPDSELRSATPRPPTATEAKVLNPAWRHILSTIGLSEPDFSVWVRDSPGPMGVASSGGPVIVSAEAVREFSPAELRGLLGHEIGHFVGDGGGVWYRLSWWCTALGRLLFAVAGFWVVRLTRGSDRLRLTAMAALQLGAVTGLIVLLYTLFGVADAAMLSAAAAVQMSGQGAILLRNQLNADRVSVDLGAGPGVRSYVVRLNRPADLRPRRTHPRWVRMVLWLLDVLSAGPAPDRRVSALEARMLDNRSTRPGSFDPGWAGRLGYVAFRPLGRLLYWSKRPRL